MAEHLRTIDSNGATHQWIDETRYVIVQRIHSGAIDWSRFYTLAEALRLVQGGGSGGANPYLAIIKVDCILAHEVTIAGDAYPGNGGNGRRTPRTGDELPGLRRARWDGDQVGEPHPNPESCFGGKKPA